MINNKILDIYMDSFPEWQQNKLYIEHIKRLRHIDNRSLSSNNTKRSKSKFSTKFKNLYNSASKQELKTPKKLSLRIVQRYQTEPVLKKLEELKTPTPLISHDEGKLIKSTLNSQNISLKQKERLLQNYLLSKRILETKSVINPIKIKKQFRLHQKTLINMSRSRSKGSLSQQRQINFKRYQTQRDHHQHAIEAGQGRNQFSFKIRQILLIKGIIVKNPHVFYNLRIYVGKNHYQFRALSYDELFNRKIRINFKKSLLINNPQISILLSVLRQNHQQQIGVFKPIIKNFEDRQNQVYKITKGKFPVGTIDIEGKVVYFISENSRQKKSMQQKLNLQDY